MKKLVAAVFRKGGVGVAPDPVAPDNAAPPLAKASVGSILRIRLSLDLSHPQPSSDDEIVMAHRTDSRMVSRPHVPAASTPSPPPRPLATMVHIPRSFYRVVWVVFLSVHSLMAIYLVVCAKIYSALASSPSYFITLLNTAPLSTFPLVSAGFAFIAIFHIVPVLQLIGVSLWHRQLLFHPHRPWIDAYNDLLAHVEAVASGKAKQEPPREATLRMERREDQPPTLPATTRLALWLTRYQSGRRLLLSVRSALSLWESVMGRNGMLGVDSEYFDIVVFLRKFTVLGLQSGHAYLGSLYLSRRDLKNFLVWTVVMQCIATPAIHFYCQQRHAPMERVLYLTSCAFFTFCSFVVVAGYVIHGIAGVLADDLPFDLPPPAYFDDALLVRTVKNIQFLMIVDGINVGLTFIPLIAITQCMSAIKPMLSVLTAGVVDIHTVSTPPTLATDPPPVETRPARGSGHVDRSLALPGRRTASNYSSASSIAPTVVVSRGSVATERGSIASSTASLAAKLAQLEPLDDPQHHANTDAEEDPEIRRHRALLAKGIVQFAMHHVVEEQVTQARQFRPQHYPLTGVRLHTLYVFFVLWAVVVLTFYVRASRKSQQLRQPGCHVEVRPWSTHRYACAVLEFDCIQRKSSASALNLEASLLMLHRRSLTTLIVSHCESVAMPQSIALFPTLTGLKFFNSTIIQWPVASAITQASHPRMSYAFFVHTNAVGNVSLASVVLTPTIRRLGLVNTNISIGADAAVKLPRAELLLLENVGLREFPVFLSATSSLQTLSLAWNDITDSPRDALVTMTKLASLSLAGNRQLASLPSAPTSGTLKKLVVSDTSVNDVDAWADDGTTVDASESPLCPVDTNTEKRYTVMCNGSSPGYIYPVEEEVERLGHAPVVV